MEFIVLLVISIQRLPSKQARRATTEVCWKKQWGDMQGSRSIHGFYPIVTSVQNSQSEQNIEGDKLFTEESLARVKP
jgi:hypothetical protein